MQNHFAQGSMNSVFDGVRYWTSENLNSNYFYNCSTSSKENFNYTLNNNVNSVDYGHQNPSSQWPVSIPQEVYQQNGVVL